MKKIMIAIGTEKDNPGQMNMFIDKENLGLKYWNKRGCWKYYEIEITQEEFDSLDDKMKELLCFKSGYNIYTVINAFQDLNEKYEDLKEKLTSIEKGAEVN